MPSGQIEYSAALQAAANAGRLLRISLIRMRRKASAAKVEAEPQIPRITATGPNRRRALGDVAPDLSNEEAEP